MAQWVGWLMGAGVDCLLEMCSGGTRDGEPMTPHDFKPFSELRQWSVKCRLVRKRFQIKSPF